MRSDLNFEEIVFEFVSDIKRFNELLQNKFNFSEHPYEVSGKKFLKIGEVEDDNGGKIKYRFHGRGCTFYFNAREYFFNVDTTSVHSIIITVGGFYCYLRSFMLDIDDSSPIQEVMQNLERKGVFMRRKPAEVGVFHLNEKWYLAHLHKTPFYGENKDECDWI